MQTAKNFELSAKADGLRARLAKLFFDVYGESTPPDATFSLRINDGVVKGYEYNGTEAPAKTTFFGLYDRYYSHNKKISLEFAEEMGDTTDGLATCAAQLCYNE